MASGGEGESFLFVTLDPQGRRVALSRRTFDLHIATRHPGMTAPRIEAVLARPDVILENLDHGSLNYLSRIGRGQFRLVAVKRHPNRVPQWEVATAYPRSIPPHGDVRVVWMRS